MSPTLQQTRSYMDFASVGAALDALVKMYEHKLKELNPSVQNITYDINDLYNFLDSLYDVCALVYVYFISIIIIFSISQ